MRSKTTTAVGALHPILFFAGVYVVVLLFSIFICSAIFHSVNDTSADFAKNEQTEAKQENVSKGVTTSIAAIQ